MKGGVYGDLISTIPSVTSPAWPSFMTGKIRASMAFLILLVGVRGIARNKKTLGILRLKLCGDF